MSLRINGPVQHRDGVRVLRFDSDAVDCQPCARPLAVGAFRDRSGVPLSTSSQNTRLLIGASASSTTDCNVRED